MSFLGIGKKSFNFDPSQSDWYKGGIQAIEGRKKQLQAAYDKFTSDGAPKALEMEAAPTSGPRPEFDLARKRLSQGINSGRQQSMDALSRRLASSGQLGSGTAIKQTQILNDASEQRRAEGLEGIGAQEAAAMREEGESIKGRNFAREQANAQMSFRHKLASFDNASKLAQMDLAFDDAARSRLNELYNRELNNYQAKNSGGLFGGGGFLGLG